MSLSGAGKNESEGRAMTVFDFTAMSFLFVSVLWAIALGDFRKVEDAPSGQYSSWR
jgi:hypothetical protein